MAKNQTERFRLSMAGEYGVCAELSKRGYDVSITMGNAKAVDVYVFTGNGVRRIEVKTTRSNKLVTGFFQKYFDPSQCHPDYWVLVHIDSQNISHFLMSKYEEMGNVQMQRNGKNTWGPNPGGVDNVLLKHIVQFENMWSKIV